MKKRNTFVFSFCLILTLTAIIFQNGCQYDYSTPLPGVISIRLHSKSDNIEFSPLNNFALKVTAVEAVRSDGARAVVLEDTKAIGRTTNTYNALDVRARDSNIVMGEAFLPPGDYIGVNLLVEPGTNVVLDGYRIISVSNPPDFDALVAFRQNFRIEEGVTTKIVVTIDLDNALLKGANNYYFKLIRDYPLFYENFDTINAGPSTAMGDLPLGWDRNIAGNDSASGAWGVRSDQSSSGYTDASSGNNCYTSYTGSTGSWITSPIVNISNMDYVDMWFGVRFSNGSSNQIRLNAQYSLDGSSFSSYPNGLLSSPGHSEWSLKKLSSPKIAFSNAYFRLMVTGTGEQSDIRLDDVRIVGRRLSYYVSSIQYSSN